MSRVKDLKVECPFCSCSLSTVLPKKLPYGDDGEYVRLRRCDECRQLYKTTERANITVERKARK